MMLSCLDLKLVYQSFFKTFQNTVAMVCFLEIWSIDCKVETVWLKACIEIQKTWLPLVQITTRFSAI